MGFNAPKTLEGYRLLEYEEEFTVWATVPVMDSFSIRGDPIHPARFMIELSTSSSLSISFELYTETGTALYFISNTAYIFYEHDFISPQKLLLNWYIQPLSCGFSCPVTYKIAIWEWMILEPALMEGN